MEDLKYLDVEPIITYPPHATAGDSYLMTIDLRHQLEPSEWPYEEEEYIISCKLNTTQLFSNRPVGASSVVLHRFGGTYGPAMFMLTAKPCDTAMTGAIHVTFVNPWGIPLETVALSNIRVIPKGGKSEELADVPFDPASPHTDAHRRYLFELRRHCQALPLSVLGGATWNASSVTLDQVYIDLETIAEGHQPAASLPHQQSALASLNRSAYTVLLGPMGAGKTSVVHQFLSNIVSVQLEEQSVATGVPNDLLPVLLTRHQLADVIQDGMSQSDMALVIRDQIINNLKRLGLDGFVLSVQQALATGCCLLVLDGLDDLPVSLKQYAWNLILAVIDTYHIRRVIVTCRTSSYFSEPIPDLFSVYTLLPASKLQTESFSDTWFRSIETNHRQAIRYARMFSEFIQHDDWFEMSTHPMLLTNLAITYQQSQELPYQRVFILDRMVELLLLGWQRSKSYQMPVDALTLSSIMELLSYAAFQRQHDGHEGAEIPHDIAIACFESVYNNIVWSEVEDLLEMLSQQSTLLTVAQPQNGTYNFLYPLLQAYLVAGYLINQSDMMQSLRDHAAEGAFWGAIVPLIAERLLHQRSMRDVLDLTYRLRPEEVEEPAISTQRMTLWSGKVAELAGRETLEQDDSPTGSGSAYLSRLLPQVATLFQGDLTMAERGEAGRILAHFGDVRFRPDRWYLPDDPLFGFVEIPAGSFVMGSESTLDNDTGQYEQPQHEIYLPRYFIARYPVTVAQFQAFVLSTDYPLRTHKSLDGVSNHPVVWVTWRDAIAFCDWLTDQLRNSLETPAPLAEFLQRNGAHVSLPSEPEWEKAARGSDGRRYPWGQESDPNRANYQDTGIKCASVVGQFPEGASPYGVEEMSGNILEWTRSLWAPYPYPADTDSQAKREPRQEVPERPRMLRGGAFFNSPHHIRCASRDGEFESDSSDSIGFRVVITLAP